MKKLFLLFLLATFIIGCQQESPIDQVSADYTYENGSNTEGNKVDVCHNGHIINVSVNAIPAHQGHGDAVDMDGDGYFDIENTCSDTDCDDSNYNLENNCCLDSCSGNVCARLDSLNSSNSCYSYIRNNTYLVINHSSGSISTPVGYSCALYIQNWVIDAGIPECL